MGALDEFLRGAVDDCVNARWYPPPVDCPGLDDFVPCLNPPAADGGLCGECERRAALEAERG